MKEIRLLTQDDLEDVYRLFKEASQDRKNIYTWAIYDESNISEEYFTHLLDEIIQFNTYSGSFTMVF